MRNLKKEFSLFTLQIVSWIFRGEGTTRVGSIDLTVDRGADMAWFSGNDTKSLEGGNYVLNILRYINELDESFNAEQLKCLEREHQDGSRGQDEQECEVDWDTILCWPRTLAGTLATIPCFDELNGIPYDNTRECAYVLLVTYNRPDGEHFSSCETRTRW